MTTSKKQTQNKIQPGKYVMVGWRLAIIAICTCILVGGGVVGIVGLVFSNKGRQNAVTADQMAKANTGKTLSIIAIVVGAIMAVALVILLCTVLWKYIIW